MSADKKKRKTGGCKNNGGAREGAGLKGGEALKWKTPEIRKAACKSFCAHIAAGYSMESWPEASEETVKRYTRDFPDDFLINDLDEARRSGLLFWEKLGVAGTSGKLKGFNSGSWIFNMKNRAGWADKQEIKHDGKINFVKIDDDDAEL